MVRAKIESDQIQKMFMIKLTGFGDLEIRKGDCGWLGTEDLEGEETASGKLPKKKSTQTTTKARQMSRCVTG